MNKAIFTCSCLAVLAMLALAGCQPGQNAPQSVAEQTPADNASPDANKRLACQNNLKQLGLSCKLFASEHDGRFPDTLQALYPEYTPDVSIFRCPSATQEPTGTIDAVPPSHYEIVPGLTESSPKTTILIQEKNTENHVPAGRSVLYIDGHVEFVKSEP